MADTLIFVATCADENPDKATIPFALGNSALLVRLGGIPQVGLISPGFAF